MGFKPQAGFSHARWESSTGSQFVALGPLARGDVVRRALVHVHVRAAGNWRWGASLGVSRQGTQAGLLAGRSLVTLSDVPAQNGDQGFPHIGMPVDSEMFMRFEFFPGLMVSGASGWIQVHTMNIGAGDLTIVSTFEISSFVKADGVVVGSP